VPSVSRHSTRLGVLGVCGLLLTGAAAGCSTTQEKAEIQQARAKHILDARAERQARKKHADGPKSHSQRGKSAHRPKEGGR
jgi:hypothetical protein